MYLIGLMARYPEYLDKSYEISILTRPNIDIATILIKHLEFILIFRLPLEFNKTQTTNNIKNCTIEAFPFHHIDAIRALLYPVHCLLDEAGFFPYGCNYHNNPVWVIERYLPKSNLWIVLVLTSDLTGGLCERMDKEEQKAIEEDKQPIYKTLDIITNGVWIKSIV